ncbi:MAG: hypothetical protein GY835_26330 [bacterium]|nr:hypothetical protein [bacterium]
MSNHYQFGRAVLATLLITLVIQLLPCAAHAESALTYLDSAQWTFNEDCAARGDTIYTTLAYGVQIWDAVNKENIHMLSDIYNEGQKAISIDMCDDIMAFTTANGRLKVYDVGDPADPQMVRELTGFGINADVAFQKRGGTRLCFVAGSSGLNIVDLTNPSTGDVIGELDLFGDPVSMSFFGDSLAVLSDNYGLQIVDAVDPTDPALVGSVANDDNYLYNVTTNGRIVVVATRLNGLFIYDIGTPTTPSLIVNFAVVHDSKTYWVKDALLDGDTMYVAVDQSGVVNTEQAGIRVYDMINPATPLLLGYDEEFYETINNISMADGKIYMTQWGWIKDGIHIIDVSDSANPHSLGHTQAWDFTRFAAVEDDRIYTPMGHMGCFVHTFAAPDHEPPGVGFTEGGSYFALNAWHIEMDNGDAHIATASDGYVIVDWDTSGDGSLIGSISPFSGTCRDVLLRGDVAFLAVYRSGLVSVDISNPALPTEIAEAGALTSGNQHEAIAIDIQGDLACVAERIEGLQLYRIDDNGQILAHLGQWVPGVRVVDVLIRGDYAYVCCNGYTMRVLNISDPTDPVELTSISVEALSCHIEGDFLFLAAGGLGVVVYSLADPENPLEVCRYNTTHETHSVNVSNSVVYVSDYSALLALRFIPDTPTAMNFFAVGWDGRVVDVAWEMAEYINPDDMLLTASRLSPPGPESEIPFSQNGPHSFRAVDDRASLEPGSTWRYTLYARDPGGEWERSGGEDIDLTSIVGDRLALTNFPNPFNPTTILRIMAEEAGSGRLDIFDLEGRLVTTLFNGDYEAGLLEIPWNGQDAAGRDLAGGLYFASLSSPKGRVNRRLVLIR